jgi:hypothetical protein
MTDKAARVLWVPLDETGRLVSQHELAHVKWSPETLDGQQLRAPIMFVRAVEDARVNLGLEEIGIPLAFDETICRQVHEAVEQDLARDDLVTFTLRVVASFGTNVSGSLVERARSVSRGAGRIPFQLVTEAYARLARARARQRGPVASFEQGMAVARWLAQEFRRRGFREPKEQLALVGCCSGVGPRPRDADRGRGLGGRPRRLADGVRPGRLRVVTAPLSIPCASDASRGRTRRAVAEGTELRYIHRFVTDQRVFSRATRRPAASGGGTVLIDVSGSMRLRPSDVDQIIASAPNATLVAIYAGLEDRGELRIVVRDGFRAAPTALKVPGSGNIVDLPALQWLAKQPAPRVWISDGGVTGCGDVPTAAIERRCREVRTEAGIVQVRTAAEAAEELSRRCGV